MHEEKIKNLIINWRQKSHNEGDQFASFVFIWFCFNAWLEHITNSDTDAGMIKELAGGMGISPLFLQKLCPNIFTPRLKRVAIQAPFRQSR